MKRRPSFLRYLRMQPRMSQHGSVARTGQAANRYRCDLPGGCSVFSIAGGGAADDPLPQGTVVEALGAVDANGFIAILQPNGMHGFVLATHFSSVASAPPSPSSITCAAPSGFCTIYDTLGRSRQLPNGTPLQVLQRSNQDGRSFAFVRTAVDTAGAYVLGWIDASELANAAPTPPTAGPDGIMGTPDDLGAPPPSAPTPPVYTPDDVRAAYKSWQYALSQPGATVYSVQPFLDEYIATYRAVFGKDPTDAVPPAAPTPPATLTHFCSNPAGCGLFAGAYFETPIVAITTGSAARPNIAITETFDHPAFGPWAAVRVESLKGTHFMRTGDLTRSVDVGVAGWMAQTGQTVPYSTLPGGARTGPLGRPRLPGDLVPASVEPVTMRARCKFTRCAVASPDRRRLLGYLPAGAFVRASATAPDGTSFPRNAADPSEGNLAYVRFNGGEGWMDPNTLQFEVG